MPAPDFYPRSPCGERPLMTVVSCLRPMISIHALLAESDRVRRSASHCQSHFYPRSPCGERPFAPDWAEIARRISIHALLAESDDFQVHRAALVIVFLSTLSLRRATGTSRIHALFLAHFYPRSPCGERPAKTTCRRQKQDISIHALLAESDNVNLMFAKSLFSISIHALLAESDDLYRYELIWVKISIHALLAESDRHAQRIAPINANFYPRSPCGERQ